MVKLNEAAQEVLHNSNSKGFNEGALSIPTKLALIHSEVSEALEADRKGHSTPMGKNAEVVESVYEVINWVDDDRFRNAFANNVKDTFEDELADIIIRTMELAALKGIDLEAHVEAKMRYNSLREPMHGGKKY